MFYFITTFIMFPVHLMKTTLTTYSSTPLSAPTAGHPGLVTHTRSLLRCISPKQKFLSWKQRYAESSCPPSLLGLFWTVFLNLLGRFVSEFLYRYELQILLLFRLLILQIQDTCSASQFSVGTVLVD